MPESLEEKSLKSSLLTAEKVENGAPSDGGQQTKKSVASFNPFAIYKSVAKRFFLLYRHFIGLLLGSHVATVNAMSPYMRSGIRHPISRFLAVIFRRLILKELRDLPFEVQLRRRLELLGPTYIKLGQIMAIREDLLPASVTSELKSLLDRLPEVPYPIIKQIIEDSLGKKVEDEFIRIEDKSIGSASIGQVHIAYTRDGDKVVLKVIKPGIRETIHSDLRLLKILGNILQLIIGRYQPKLIIREFCRYTEKEVDLTYEADHAEMFAANFSEYPDVVFPKIYRHLSSRDVLCMEFMDGLQPNDPRIFDRYGLEDLDRIIDLGSGSIIKMLYEDGFFHADLHAGNMVILPGPKVGFIDLGMVGRFDEKIKRQMLYYFYYLVMNEIDHSAKYLLAMASFGKKSDPAGFKRAVTDLANRFRLQAAYGNFSLAKMILESISIGGKYRVYFPVEMTLMVKALVTFEGVGLTLNPAMNIPEISEKHVNRIFKSRYSPKFLAEKLLYSIPEMADIIVRLPEIISNSSRFWEDTIDDSNNTNPMAGLRSGLIAGSCIVGGVIAVVQGANPLLWIGLFATGIGLSLFGKS